MRMVSRANRFGVWLILLAVGMGVLLAASPQIPDYSETPRDQVPEACKWRLQDLYPDTAAWQAEKDAVTKTAGELDERAKDWTASAERMCAFVDWLSGIQQRAMRLMVYASLQGDGDLANPQYKKMQGELRMLFVGFQAKLGFMNPDILKLGQENLDAYVKAEPRLAPYKVNFDRVLREKDHILPADQQRLVSLTGMFARSSGQASSMLNDVDIPRPEVTLSNGATVLLNTANYGKYRASANEGDRRLVMESYWHNQQHYLNTFAVLMDAAMKQQFYQAQTHNYPDCLTAALFDNDIDPAVYYNLIATVRENLGPLHRLLRLRARLLGLKEMRYGDVYASAAKSVDKRYTFDEARDLVLAAMQPLGPDYEAGLKKAFAERWIDIYPNKGKQSGAYSSGVYGVHPYVKLNFDGSYSNVSTLAHELGHSMHSYFSNQAQPFPTANYPIFLAEVASTFNENMLMHQMLKSETDDNLKLFLLDGYLERIRATLYRQALFAEFELAMHQQVEQGKTLTPDWLNQKYLELTRTYYGQDQGVMNVEDYIQCEWSGIPHFFMNYYVFQYSTGIVASMALSDMVLRDGAAGRDRYLAFLKAGDSKFPLDTLRDAGIDMSSPEPVKAAIREFDRMVGEMETIVDRLEAAK
jgi:oligoendopeptidase F